MARAEIRVTVVVPDGSYDESVLREAEGNANKVRALVQRAASPLAPEGIVDRTFEITSITPPPRPRTWPFDTPVNYWGQGAYWTDAKGTKHAISDMSLDYVSNVVYLLKHEAYKVRNSLPELMRNPLDTYLAHALQRRLLEAAEGLVQRPIRDR